MTVTYDRHVGDQGATLRVALGANCPDLTGATVVVEVRKPSGALSSWTTTNHDNGAKTVDHVFVAGDLDEAGNYQTQGRVTTAGGAIYHGAIASLAVGKSLVLS